MPARTDAPAPPGARAVARYVRTSASKARRVVDLVRGLPAKEALTVLRFAPQAASVPVYKVVASAIANAENNEQLDPDSLLIAEAYVDEGPTMRRYRPRAQMRPGPIRKRTCHITIAVEAVQPAAAAAPRRARKATPAVDEPTAEAAAGAAEPTATEEPTGAPAKRTAKQAAKKTATKATGAEAPVKPTVASKSAKQATGAEAPTKKTAASKSAKQATEDEAPTKKTAKKAAGAEAPAKPTAARKPAKKAAPKPAGTEEGTE